MNTRQSAGSFRRSIPAIAAVSVLGVVVVGGLWGGRGHVGTGSRTPPVDPAISAASTATTIGQEVSAVPPTSMPSTNSTAAAPLAAETSTIAPSPEVTPQPWSGVAPSPLPGAGDWQVLASVSGAPVIWGATNQPIAGHPDITASYAVFDPKRLHAALFNGTELPGGGPWNNGSAVMDTATPSLVAAFNGGFLFKHINGGYFTEGTMVKPLIDGDATLGVGTNGELAIGVYGSEMTNDGSWVSLRQNLPPVVNGGREAVSAAAGSIYWGDNFGHVLLDFRSALCRRSDGLLMYVVAGLVDINGLANVLVTAHCDFAMELDINGTWPQFVSFTQSGGNQPIPTALDTRMRHLSRYLTGSTKDFIALFDPTQLPANVVR